MIENELIMLVNDIRKKKCESNYIELKAAAKGCPKIFDTLSSFSNQESGGKIIFGIDENNNYDICGVYDAADLQKKIMEQSLQMEPVVRPLCTVATIDGKTVVCAEIQGIDNFSKPCFYKGVGRLKGSYIRVADGDRLMTEYEIYSYEAFKKKIEDELRIADRANIEDIMTNNLEKYLLELRSKKANFTNLSNEKICRLQGFINESKPTLAGVMMFSDYPQAFFPQLCITAVSIPGTEMSEIGSVGERFIDNERIDGTFTQMLNDALIFVRKNIKSKTIIDKNTGKRVDKPDYPIVAIRELIINALVHRDYSIHTDYTPITIKIFSDRFEIENPGGLYGRMTIDQLGKVSADTRNPFIANALEILGETENRYSGIPTIINAMKEYGLPEPKFESERGIFRATLYNQSNQETILSFEEEEIMNFCKVPKSRAEIEKLFNGRFSIAYVMSKYIHPMVKKGILKLTIPNAPKSKNQKYVTERRISF
ncbi:MAG: ATP-binding protein [Clostridium sp.]|nr:ATP-binding protein [Clostridium sp.]